LDAREEVRWRLPPIERERGGTKRPQVCDQPAARRAPLEMALDGALLERIQLAIDVGGDRQVLAVHGVTLIQP
jgi:hypothetical protein